MPNNIRSWQSYNIIVNIVFKASFFPIIGKKNNQSSVPDADREIPTIGSMNNAGNSVVSFPALSVYPLVRISLSASKTDDRFYLYYSLGTDAHQKKTITNKKFSLSGNHGNLLEGHVMYKLNCHCLQFCVGISSI